MGSRWTHTQDPDLVGHIWELYFPPHTWFLTLKKLSCFFVAFFARGFYQNQPITLLVSFPFLTLHMLVECRCSTKKSTRRFLLIKQQHFFFFFLKRPNYLTGYKIIGVWGRDLPILRKSCKLHHLESKLGKWIISVTDQRDQCRCWCDAHADTC